MCCQFIGKHKLHGATASAIASFNEGSSHLSQVMQKMAIETNELLNVYMEEIDQRRITSANVSSSATTKRERAWRWIRKRQEHVNLEADEGPSYAAGGF